MKKSAFLLISALVISLSSYAQGDFGENGFIYSGDGTEYIDGEASIKLYDFGFKIVMMSGSGSSVFAMSTDKNLVNEAFKTIEGNFKVIKTKVLR